MGRSCLGEIRTATFYPPPNRAGKGAGTEVFRVNRWNSLVHFKYETTNGVYPGGQGSKEAFLTAEQAREVAGLLLKAAEDAETS